MAAYKALVLRSSGGAEATDFRRAEPPLANEITRWPERMMLPGLPGDRTSGRVSLDDATSDIDADDIPKTTGLPRVLTILCHEDGRDVFRDDCHVVHGFEFFGPVVVVATWFDTDSGIEFYADITDEDIASLPERMRKRANRDAALVTRFGW